MIRNFLEGQMDYVISIYGLAFVLVAATGASMSRESDGRLPWKWISLFGAAHALVEWLDMLGRTVAKGLWWNWNKAGLLFLSGVFLVEFSRRAAAGMRRKGLLIYPAGVLIMTYIGWSSPVLLQIGSRYALLLPGGLLGALMVRQEALRSTGSTRKSLNILGVSLLLYSLAAGIIVPQASVFPAAELNSEAFLRVLGIPIEIVRMTLALSMGFGLWAFSRTVGRPLEATIDERPGVWILSFLLLILAIGGVLTYWTGGARISEKVFDATADYATSQQVSSLKRLPIILVLSSSK